MAITIGNPEPGFNDPIGLLTACHRRIERFLGALHRLARDRKGGELTALETEAMETALKYFRTAAPHHTADEERGLFPALEEAVGSTPEVERLEGDHRRADKAHAKVDRLGLLWLREGRLNAEQAAAMLSALEELAELYRDHIRVEEEIVFPKASESLSRDALTAMGRDMASRRGAVYIPDATVSISEARPGTK